MTLIYQRSLFLLLFFAGYSIKCATVSNKVYKLDRSGNCPKFKPNSNMTMDFSGFKQLNELRGFTFTGAINVSSDVKGLLSVRVVTQRCELKCNNFTDVRFENYCPRLLNNPYVGDALTKMTEPHFKCPIKKGLYVASSILFNMSSLDYLPYDNQKWKITHEFFDYNRKKGGKRRPIGCWLLQITRTTFNNRKRGGGRR